MFKKLSDLLDLKSHKNGQAYGKDLGFNFLSLIHKWPNIIGDKLSKVTIPVKMQYGILTIMTNHPAYSQSLSFLEAELTKKIIREFPNLQGHLKSFQFRVNTNFFEEEKNKLIQRSHNLQQQGPQKTVANTPRTFHPHNPEYKKIKQEALEYFENLEEDEEIKSNLVSLYIQSKISSNE